MRLWCGGCGKSCGRVERDSDDGWVYIGAVKVSPLTYYGDPTKPWQKMSRRLDLSEPGVLYARLTCSGGHTIVTDSAALLTAVRSGRRSMTLPVVAPADDA